VIDARQAGSGRQLLHFLSAPISGEPGQALNGSELTGFGQSWWLGLSGMHTLFAREHNLLCDELCRHHRNWDVQHVYQTARLIVSALIAKIHTIEWTPAILATKPPGDRDDQHIKGTAMAHANIHQFHRNPPGSCSRARGRPAQGQPSCSIFLNYTSSLCAVLLSVRSCSTSTSRTTARLDQHPVLARG
jgi:hypothetical protein